MNPHATDGGKELAAEIVNVETIYEGWGRFLLASVKQDDGHMVTREIEDHGSAVAILPYDPERQTVMLVQQFRAPYLYASGKDRLLEVPAGRIEEADPEVCARRELFEEVGIRPRTLEHVASVYTMPGVSTELIHLYIAQYASTDIHGKGGGIPEEGEQIAVVELPIMDALKQTGDSSCVDAKSLLLMLILQQREPHLFT